jgi:type II secretory pathway pseudopilin PulG
MNTRGFTFVELLVAAATVLVVAAALSGLSRGMQRAFDRSVSNVDATGRARSALAAVAAELHRAGSGIAIGAPLQGLVDLTPVVLPRQSLDNAALAAPFTAVTVLRATGGQGVLRDPVLAGSAVLRLDADAPSPRQDGTGGFKRGDVALVFDTSRSETVVISSVTPAAWLITLEAPLRHPFEAGAVVAAIERTTYGLRADGAGRGRLVRRTTGGAEQPVVDHVAAFEVSLWGSAEPPRPGAHPAWFPTYGPSAPALHTDDERDSWGAGENCTLALDGAGERVPRLAQLAPAAALVELTPAVFADGPWCPDPADAEAFAADLLRLTRIDLHLRVDVAAADMQAPAKPVSLFTSVALRQR